MNTIYEDKELAAKLKEAMEGQKKADVAAVEAAVVAEPTVGPEVAEPRQAL